MRSSTSISPTSLIPDPLPTDPDEYLERRAFPFAEALAMAQDDRITCGLTKLAILWIAVARTAVPAGLTEREQFASPPCRTARPKT